MSSQQKPTPSILVVDDEEIVLSFVSDALEDSDYSVDTALDGNSALKLIERKNYDLLITDIRMPELDGIDLVERARRLQPNIGVIFMTGYANLQSAKNAIQQGAFDYILKPFELNEIRQAVAKAMKITRDYTTKGSDIELTRISNLNQVLFTAGDRKSLVSSSLTFTMMNHEISCGAAIIRDRSQSRFDMISIIDDRYSEKHFEDSPLGEILDGMDISNCCKPHIISSLEEHPLYTHCQDAGMARLLYPEWADDCTRLILVPIFRSREIYGFMMLGDQQSDTSLSETDCKFLCVTASQLAITLENSMLLEESRSAFERLKALQDETINLEKMATRGQISAEIGHELNNFLGVLAGNLSMLEVQANLRNYEKLDKYVSAMTEAMERIKEFTGNLMDLTPVSTRMTPIEVNRLLTDVEEYLRLQHRFDQINLTVEKLPETAVFNADISQLQQLLYNLFNNSADAMLDQPVREIRVSASLLGTDKLWRLTIADTGIGFESEKLAVAFKERFTTKQDGHGLGLMVCKRIIENHGAHLTVESEPGKGTSISIDFPVTHCPDAIPVSV
jgi:signal transduction histidine kinase/CheY-like chemotaxis protein